MAIWSRHKVFSLAKGYYKRSNNCFRIAIRRVFKALQYEYRDRRIRRRQVRTNWIQNINAGVKEHGLMYSRFIYGLNRSNIHLDRKILADLCKNEPYSFKAVVDEIKIQNNFTFPIQKRQPIMNYDEAIELQLLKYGKYVPKTEIDREYKFASATPGTKDEDDWFGYALIELLFTSY